MVSSRDQDKSRVFRAFYGKLGNVPLARECPINLECRLIDSHDLGRIIVCYGEVVETHVSANCFDGDIIDIARVDPMLISLPQEQYRRVDARPVAQAFQAWKEYRPPAT
jgi:flavin reductase (DIM6/NTAB) family NADH-FMN oxidoreductase RutF